MFKFSKIATLEKNKLSTDAPFLVCIEMKNDMLDEPVRLVRNTEDITWNKSTMSLLFLKNCTFLIYLYQCASTIYILVNKQK